MPENNTSTGLSGVLKAHPIMYLTSIVFGLIGFLQFSGFLDAFDDRLGGLLLTLFALQSLILVGRVKSSHDELRAAVTEKLDTAIGEDFNEVICDSFKHAFEERSQPTDLENKIGLFDMPETLSDVFADAEKIMVVGVSASSLYQLYSEELEARSKRVDRSTRFLLVHPDSPALPLVCQRDNTELSAAVIYQKKRSEALLEELGKLQMGAEGNFSIRRSEYPIDCEYIFADYGQHKAIFIRHYTFKTAPGGELKVQLRNGRTQNFQHYHQHLRMLWNDGEEFTA